MVQFMTLPDTVKQDYDALVEAMTGLFKDDRPFLERLQQFDDLRQKVDEAPRRYKFRLESAYRDLGVITDAHDFHLARQMYFTMQPNLRQKMRLKAHKMTLETITEAMEEEADKQRVGKVIANEKVKDPSQTEIAKSRNRPTDFSQTQNAQGARGPSRNRNNEWQNNAPNKYNTGNDYPRPQEPPPRVCRHCQTWHWENSCTAQRAKTRCHGCSRYGHTAAEFGCNSQNTQPQTGPSGRADMRQSFQDNVRSARPPTFNRPRNASNNQAHLTTTTFYPMVQSQDARVEVAKAVGTKASTTVLATAHTDQSSKGDEVLNDSHSPSVILKHQHLYAPTKFKFEGLPLLISDAPEGYGRACLTGLADTGADVTCVSVAVRDRLLQHYESEYGLDALQQYYRADLLKHLNTSAGVHIAQGEILLKGTRYGEPFQVWTTVIEHLPTGILVGNDLLRRFNIVLIDGQQGESRPLPSVPSAVLQSGESFLPASALNAPYIPTTAEAVNICLEENWCYLNHPALDGFLVSPFVNGQQEAHKARYMDMPIDVLPLAQILTVASDAPTHKAFTSLAAMPDRPHYEVNKPAVTAEQRRKAYASPVTPDDVIKSEKDLITDLKLQYDAAELSDEQRSRMSTILTEYKERVFAHSDVDIGCTQRLVHDIKLLPGSRPVKQKARPVTQAQEQAVKEEVAKYLRFGVISPACSEWSSPVVLVMKRSGEIRFCIDFRLLNRMSRVDTFPTPNQQQLLAQLRGARVFSSFDIASAYWQIPMAESAKDITTFACSEGTFRWESMPFGLLNSGSTFNRLIADVFRNYIGRFVLAYIDDIVVFSATIDEHIEHLRLLFEAVAQAYLKFKPKKCYLFRSSVEYLGHTVTTDGLCICDRNIEKAKAFPRPTNKRELQAALGLFNFFRQFISHYAAVARPLTQLLAGTYATSDDWQKAWTPNQEVTFQWLKHLVTTPPVLAHPDFDRPWSLYVDASKDAFGAVLCQVGDDTKEHVIAYASTPTTVAQSKRGATRLEAEAILWAVRFYRFYLDGHRTVVYTDCQPLIPMFESPKSSHEIYREAILLQHYDLKVCYRPGEQNTAADALSRAPFSSGYFAMSLMAWVYSTLDRADLSLLQRCVFGCTEDDFIYAQTLDPETRDMLAYLTKDKVPSQPSRRLAIMRSQSRFLIVGGVLCRKGPSGMSFPVVPLSMRRQVLNNAHISRGHYGVRRIYDYLKTRVWWMGMHADLVVYTASCGPCARFNDAYRKIVPPLHPIHSIRPFNRVEIDCTHLPKSKNGYQVALCFLDTFTKWAEVVPFKREPTAKQVVAALEDVIISRHGIPTTIHSDRAANLDSKVMANAAKLGRFQYSTSYSWTPRSQGNVERFQKTLKRILLKWGNDENLKRIPWDELLPAALLAYRTTIHRSTAFSPYHLLFGRDCTVPLGFTTNAVPAPTTLTVDSIDFENYATALATHMSQIWDQSSETLRNTQEANAQAFERKRSYKMPNIRLHDTVMLYHPSIPRSSGRAPYTGPYQVKELLSTGAILIPEHECSEAKTDENDETTETEVCDVCTNQQYLVGLHRLKLVAQPTRARPIQKEVVCDIPNELHALSLDTSHSVTNCVAFSRFSPTEKFENFEYIRIRNDDSY
ncbi:MAG: reverse transcriptase domain-containing protein [Verrucomicrobiota bacterium]